MQKFNTMMGKQTKRSLVARLTVVQLVVLLPFGLSGCFSVLQVKDSGPTRPVEVSHIPDAEPRVEPRTIAGNKSPYTVLGKTYYVMPDSDNYNERGTASWYGRKFHGERTSNGEIYDMYAMTAAHKTLPIPSYVQVTNLANGKKVIVRVNDRGPFHGGRIIDLSYTAAKKLDFHDKGTAAVEVVAIDPIAYQQNKNGTVATVAAVSPSSTPTSIVRQGTPVASNTVSPIVPSVTSGSKMPSNTFLQAGAFANQDSATNLRSRIEQLIRFPVFIEQVDAVQRLFKVRIGPIVDNLDIVTIKELLQQNNLPVPHVVYD